MIEEITEIAHLFGRFDDFDTTEIGWQVYFAFDENIDQNINQNTDKNTDKDLGQAIARTSARTLTVDENSDQNITAISAPPK